jgi:outer membrane protein OmpA-like peptidoglycan-associated protein
MKKLVLYALLSGIFSLSAQKATIEAANKLYHKKLYAEAMPKYEKALKKDSNNTEVLGRLGDCYRLTNNLNGQILCYGKLVNNGTGNSDHKFYYGKALMQQGEYEEAKKLFSNYVDDPRGSAIAKGISEIDKMNKNSDAYKLSEVPFNSPDNDFCAIAFGEKIVFTSSRTKSTWVTRHQGWTDKSYFSSYVTFKDLVGTYKQPKPFLEGIDSRFNDGPISIAKDGKTIFYTRNSTEKKNQSTDGSYKLRIYQATILKNKLFKPIDLNFNNNEFNCAHPAISMDGKTLFFASDMDGGQGGMDIWYSQLGSDGIWGTPINMGTNVNTKGNEMFPYVTADNLLYFSSDGREGFGGLDVYEVKLKDLKPGKVYNMGSPVNGPYDDFSYFLNDDTKTGFVSSNRKNGGMNDDIYAVEVLRKVSRGKNVTFVLKDKDNGNLLSGVKLKINSDIVTTDEKGELVYLIEDDVNYKVIATKEKYFSNTDSVNSKSSEEDDFTRTIFLEKDPNLSFLAFVTDVKTKQGLKDVKIKITDLLTKEVVDSTKTSANGEYRKKLSGKKIGDKIVFEIVLEKEGYLTNKLNYTPENKLEGEIKLHEVLNMSLSKVEVGVDLAKMIDLKPIYFDLGKSAVRKDAAVELDKIIAIMKQYPSMFIELGSHTDCRGNAKANLSLSDKRAKASAAYIVKNGIQKNRIVGKGYGETKLLNGCACEGKIEAKCSEDEHSKNRRTEFIITKMK